MEDLKTWTKSTVTGQRLLLAAKAALAVAIAWFLAPYMPGVADDYPYYAPLGVLVSMYPTFMGSVRAGVQTLIGLLLGILLASGVLMLGSPNIVTISLAVGLGVLVAGQQRLGAGREYVPVATLLVLIIGGQNAESFSLGYLIQMSLGVVVGLIVNVTVFPPLMLDAARLRMSRGRIVLIRQLEDMAKALVEEWPPTHEEWADRKQALAATVTDIRSAVQGACESHKANPRAFRFSRHSLVAESFDDLAGLEDIAFYIRDRTEVLSGAMRGPLAGCLQGAADILKAWDNETLDAGTFETAQGLLDELASTLGELGKSDASSLTQGSAVALDVRRILAALRRRLPPIEQGD